MKNIKDLQKIENQIYTMIQVHRLESVLLGLRDASSKIESFVAAGITLFAVKHCTAGHRIQKLNPLHWNDLKPICEIVQEYLLSDPISFDETILNEHLNSNPVFMVLRVASNQMPYNVSIFGQFAQPFMLFHEIPCQMTGRSDLPKFDFEAEFMKLNRVSVIDFLTVAFVAYTAAQANSGFTRAYFNNAKNQGLQLPNDKTLVSIIDQLAADPKKFMDLYRRFKGNDCRFAMYDFNPLFIYPIIRPWRHKKGNSSENDRFIAPLPNMISFRASLGVFYQMYNKHTEDFAKYFGYVFETYVGRILEHSLSSETLISENNIRKTYPAKRGKVPDWVIIDDSTLILVECKATRFSRAAVTTANRGAIDNSLKQVVKGLKQIHNFIQASQAKEVGLEILQRCSRFIPVLVTLEPLYLINSYFFREHINALLAKEGVLNLPWLILSVDELEKLQPHTASDLRLSEMVNELYSKTFSIVLEEACSKTGRTFKDSFLYNKFEEMYDRLTPPEN